MWGYPSRLGQRGESRAARLEDTLVLRAGHLVPESVVPESEAVGFVWKCTGLQFLERTTVLNLLAGTDRPREAS